MNWRPIDISQRGFLFLKFYVSPKLAVVGLSIIPPIAIVAITYGRFVHKLTQQVNDALADATQVGRFFK